MQKDQAFLVENQSQKKSANWQTHEKNEAEDSEDTNYSLPSSLERQLKRSCQASITLMAALPG